MTSELDALEKELAELDGGGKDGGPKRKLGTAPIVVAVLAVFALGGLVYYAYDQGIREGTEVAAPLLTPTGPAKVKPEDPGGLAVPHRDKSVYNVVQGGASDTSEEKVETLLPPPEEPMVPPAGVSAGGEGAPIVTATNQLNGEAKASVPQISPPPLPSEQLAAPAAPVTLSEQAEQKVEAAQEAAQEAAKEAAKEAAQQPVQKAVEESAQDTAANTSTVPAQTAAITPPPSKPEPAAEQPSDPASTETAAKSDAAVQGTDPTISQKWRVQVGAVRSQDAAVKEWARIVRLNKELVGDLTLQIQEVDVTGKGTFFRIRGGPLADKSTAEGLCGKLKAQNIPCIPVRPGA